MVNLSMAADAFAETLRGEGRSQSTVDNVVAELRLLAQWLAANACEWSNVTTEQLAAHQLAFDATHSVPRNRIHRTYIARFYAFATQQGWLAEVPYVPVGRAQALPLVSLSESFSRAVEEYCVAKTSESYSPLTLKQYRRLLTTYGIYLATKKLNWRTVKVGDIRAFLTTYGATRVGRPAHDKRYRTRRSKTTKALMCTCVRSFYRWADESEVIVINHAAKLGRSERDEPLPRALTEAQVATLIAKLNAPIVTTPQKVQLWQRNRMIVLMMLFTGMRLSETASLCWEMLDSETRTIRVVRKGDKEALVVMHAYLVDELQAYRATLGNPETGPLFVARYGGALTNEGISEMFRTFVRDQLGVPVTAHQLRHTFATTLVNRDQQLHHIQIALGHKNIQTTQTYTHIAAKNVHALVAQLPESWQRPTTPATPPADPVPTPMLPWHGLQAVPQAGAGDATTVPMVWTSLAAITPAELVPPALPIVVPPAYPGNGARLLLSANAAFWARFAIRRRPTPPLLLG